MAYFIGNGSREAAGLVEVCVVFGESNAEEAVSSSLERYRGVKACEREDY